MADKDEKAGTKGDKDQPDFNQMWNTFYKLEEALDPIMSSNENSGKICPKTGEESCPSGHYLAACKDNRGFRCRQCSDETFQPNENWLNDKCRMKKICQKPNMSYRDVGSTIRDASCQCDEGYHFLNEDQRTCRPNKSCPRGYEPGIYGNCESCHDKAMYSDTEGPKKRCKVLTNCGKQHRCIIKPSNGIYDNVCGQIVKDLKTCKELEPPSSSSNTATAAIACGVAGFITLIVVVFVLLMCMRRQRTRQKKKGQRPLTMDEMEELKQTIVKECDKNPVLFKKVFSTSCSFIEERIDRQRWTLAQELFRSHPVEEMYEELVKKYKDTQAKYTINGYLNDFKDWKRESKETISEMFRCLHQVKRDDIVNEICTTLQSDVGYQRDEYVSIHKDSYHQSVCCPCLLFCAGNQKKPSSASSGAATNGNGGQQRNSPTVVVVVDTETKEEAGRKLLAIATDDIDDDDDDLGKGNGQPEKPPGTFYPDPHHHSHPHHPHPSPSAPELEDMGEPILPNYASVKYSRQYSQPVQATS